MKNQQLSLFDIVLEKPKEPIEQKVTKEKVIVNHTLATDEICPYRIPTLEEIIKLIEKATESVNGEKFISDVFQCGAIAISNQFDLKKYDEREERYKQIINSYRPQERELMVQVFGLIFGLLSSVAFKNGKFDDYLGKLFMRCNMGNSSVGQFFTPYHISEYMARSIITDDDIKRNEIMTILDPCCGGGGLLIAAIDVLKNQYGVNYSRDCFVIGCDIDIRCVHMTYLQLALAGVPAIIRHQNALTNEVWDVWETPAYIMQFMRFQQFKNY